jgi:hypothetical protein
MKSYNGEALAFGSPELKLFIKNITHRLKQGEVVPVTLEDGIYEVKLDLKSMKVSVLPKDNKFQISSSGITLVNSAYNS